MTQERETLLDEFDAVMTNLKKPFKLVLRFVACSTRLVEAIRSAAPDVEALLEERQALFDEVEALLRDILVSMWKVSACYEGFIQDSRTTPEEVEKVSQGGAVAGRAVLRLVGVWLVATSTSQPEIGERYDAIMARTARAGHVPVKGLDEFIAMRAADAGGRRG